MPGAKTGMVRLAPRLTEASLGCVVKTGRAKAAPEVPWQMENVGDVALYSCIHVGLLDYDPVGDGIAGFGLILQIGPGSEPWEGEPSRGPLIGLLTRDYAVAHGTGPRWNGKQQIVVCIVDVGRSSSGELAGCLVQCESFNFFYEARKLYRRTASKTASKVNCGGRELEVACPNPCAVTGGHKFGTRRPRG